MSAGSIIFPAESFCKQNTCKKSPKESFSLPEPGEGMAPFLYVQTYKSKIIPIGGTCSNENEDKTFGQSSACSGDVPEYQLQQRRCS